MRQRQLAPGKRERRLDRTRRLELADGGAYSIPGKPVEMRNAERIGVDSARVYRAHPVVGQSVALQRHLGSDLGANGISDLRNKVENVGGLARMALCPKMCIALAVNQLDSHLDLIAFPQQASHDQRVHAQLASNVGRGEFAVAIAFRGLPRRDSYPGELRKLSNQEVLEAVDVVVLFRVTGQVIER